MASTAFTITSASYVDCGAGPSSIVRKSEGPLLVYFGALTPSDDTASILLHASEKGIDYGGTDKAWLKAAGAQTVLVVVIT